MKEERLRILVEYEIRSSWWVQYANSSFLQKIAGEYYAKKTKRKYARFKRNEKTRELLRKEGLI